MHAMSAENVADDDRDTAEGGERWRTPADPNLHAAVERISRPELVNGSGVDRDDGCARGFLPRVPERFEIWVPVVRDSRTRRHRHEMLDEMWIALSAADAADAVIDVDMAMAAD